MVAGIVLELLFASLAMWTVYLMVILYLDHKNRKVCVTAGYKNVLSKLQCVSLNMYSMYMMMSYSTLVTSSL